MHGVILMIMMNFKKGCNNSLINKSSFQIAKMVNIEMIAITRDLLETIDAAPPSTGAADGIGVSELPDPDAGDCLLYTSRCV